MQDNKELATTRQYYFAQESNTFLFRSLQRKFLIGYPPETAQLLECLIENKICGAELTVGLGFIKSIDNCSRPCDIHKEKISLRPPKCFSIDYSIIVSVRSKIFVIPSYQQAYSWKAKNSVFNFLKTYSNNKVNNITLVNSY